MTVIPDGRRFVSAAAGSSFDTTEYRQNTYGAPTHFCDPNLSVASPSGSGTFGDPWNLTRAKTDAVAGNVVGFFPAATPAVMASTQDGGIPAFDPTNSGTVGNRIVFVTKYAAIALNNLWSNSLRTELRHDGTHAVGAGGTGCAVLGSDGAAYITFDGFALDSAQAEPKQDSGVIRAAATGIHFRNFEIKGHAMEMDTNAVLWRPNGAVDGVLHNFRAYDFTNTGSQRGLFSDHYDDTNFLVEHFHIYNTQRGLFIKGSNEGGPDNYGTIRYGIVSGVEIGFMFDFLRAGAFHTYLHNCIAYDITRFGIGLKSQTQVSTNFTAHHVTVARYDAGHADSDGYGALENEGQGINDGGGNVHFRDILVDMNATGTLGRAWAFCVNTCIQDPSTPATMDYIRYYKQGNAISWQYWPGPGGIYTTFSAWQTAIQAAGGSGMEANSGVLSSGPFVDRANADFRISDGHEAKTQSSTSGEIGAYGELPAGVTVGPYGSYGF